ncbi:phosphoribosylglycinamide formyltransferase [Roseomonas sp. SSH11]|uniref:Phosphoribosylglycinamide formyltransferase n=1 Tax=Pararoseomonas baculiformis TaxID=2820812 RepID=A0ABS4AA67_9PROT|nr:phosphoribosylglycinamide formyltransferase [Pararoseomonas baculiformis]MBP0443470.1 phosphoribosylglycinamide formyltransferase [Pararoseomonas baculiformis]
MAQLKRRVAVLISGRGSNLGALIAAARHPDYPAELALVLSNKADAAGLERAREAGIPTAVVESRPFGKDRAGFEAAMQARLDEAGIGLIALAGFMRVLTEGFVSAWAGRMLNIHPSLLPAFPGLDTHARALAAGVRLHGCTVHFVTPGVDEGPVIAQAAVPVLPGDDEAALAGRVLGQEHRLYPAALAWVASGAARLEGGRVALDVPMAEGAFANPLPALAALPTETT